MVSALGMIGSDSNSENKIFRMRKVVSDSFRSLD